MIIITVYFVYHPAHVCEWRRNSSHSGDLTQCIYTSNVHECDGMLFYTYISPAPCESNEVHTLTLAFGSWFNSLDLTRTDRTDSHRPRELYACERVCYRVHVHVWRWISPLYAMHGKCNIFFMLVCITGKLAYSVAIKCTALTFSCGVRKGTCQRKPSD